MMKSKIEPRDTVRLMATIPGVFSKPIICDGTASTTAKTVKVPADEYEDFQKNFQLNAEKLEQGESVSGAGSAYLFVLYTPERVQSSQKANLAPGPQTGANRVAGESELPEPTHNPD